MVSCAVTPLQQGPGGFGNQSQVVMAGLPWAEKFMKNKEETLGGDDDGENSEPDKVLKWTAQIMRGRDQEGAA